MQQQPVQPAGAVRPRLVVYDVPSLPALLETLRALYPQDRVEASSTWPAATTPQRSVIPVWYIPLTGEELQARSASLIRDLGYPLAMSNDWYVVAFAAPKSELAVQEIGLKSLPLLDVEDLWKLLTHDAAAELQFSELRDLATRTPLTPIEERLAAAFTRAGITAEPQVRFGRYVVDFVVGANGTRFAVEADGAAFHDPVRDAARDAELKSQMGLADVVRFTGREIYRDADACARYVQALLNGTRAPRRTLAPRRQTLDASQRTAVEHGDGPARVLAPAGAGKTRVLVERIAELVARGVEPSSILALAFNKKANDQLVARLDELGIPTSPKRLFDRDVSGVRCATFNAFGYRFQRERLGITFDTDANGTRIRKLMEQAAAPHVRGTKRGTDPLREFLRARERACADLTPADEIEVELDYIGEQQPRVIDYGPVDAEYERLRLAEGIQSFDDQLTTTVKELLRSPKERAFVQGYFSHVLVDEFQDLNAAQLALVDILSRPWRGLFVVGDDDQLIYGWRYAKLTNILDFEQRLPGASTYVLSTNYRCSAAVVESSRRVIDQNKRRVPKDTKPRHDAPAGILEYRRDASWEERGRAMVDFVRDAKTRTGEWREIAVLCRYKAEQPFVAMALDRAGIPRTPLLRYRLFSDRQMKLLYGYLKLIRQPTALSGDEFAYLLNRPNRYASNALVRELRNSAQPWTMFTAALDEAPEDEYPWSGLRGFKRRAEELHRRVLDPWKAIEEAVTQFELERFWRDAQKPSNKDQDDANPLELLELIRLHARESDSLDSFLTTWKSKIDEEDAMAGMDNDELRREQDADTDRVVIGTLHASKGREYDAVVLFDYNPDLAKLNDEQLEEERRVFYVGMTRARDELLITIDASKEIHPFIRASVAPLAPGEHQSLQSRDAMILSEIRNATADVAQAHERLEEIGNGTERRRLETKIDGLRGSVERLQEEISVTENEVAMAEEELDACRFWHRFTGRQSEILTRLDGLREQLAAPVARLPEVEQELARDERELSLLKHDPGQYGIGFVEAARAAEERIELLKAEQRSIGKRLAQAQLLIGNHA